MSECKASVQGLGALIYLEKVCLPVVGVLGIIGNLGAIFLQFKSRVESTFSHSLITLATINVFFVSIVILDTLDLDLDLANQMFISLMPGLLYPLKNILLCFETFLIMSIATERYQAVRSPILFRQSSIRVSSSLHLLTYILPPMVVSVLVNIPKFFETELVTLEYVDEANLTHKYVDYNTTSLSLSPAYMLYYTHWTCFLSTGVVPFLYLLAINILICRKMKAGRHVPVKPLIAQRRKTPPRQRVLAVHRQSSSDVAMRVHSTRASRSERPTSLPVIISFLYLVCNIPRLLLFWTEWQLQEQLEQCSVYTQYWLIVLQVTGVQGDILHQPSVQGVNNVCLTLHSSTSCLIYFSLNKSIDKLSNRILWRKAKVTWI